MKIISKRIFKIGYDSYAVLNEKGEKIGILKKDGYSHICKSYDDSGACAGIAQKHAEMNETAMSAIFSFRERIVDSKILDFLQAIIEKSLRSVISGIVDSETFDAVQGFLEKDAPRFLIRSEKDETIAVCSIGKTCDLTIFDTEDNDTDKRLVIGLSFLVSGL